MTHAAWLSRATLGIAVAGLLVTVPLLIWNGAKANLRLWEWLVVVPLMGVWLLAPWLVLAREARRRSADPRQSLALLIVGGLALTFALAIYVRVLFFPGSSTDAVAIMFVPLVVGLLGTLFACFIWMILTIVRYPQ